jgi:hypothetical protein
MRRLFPNSLLHVLEYRNISAMRSLISVLLDIRWPGLIQSIRSLERLMACVSARNGFVLLGFTCCLFAQKPSEIPSKPAPARPARPPLFFTEEWKQPSTPAIDHGAWPVSADDVSNPNLKLQFYGIASKDLMLSGTHENDLNPLNLWNGMCASPIAATLRDKNNYVDLTGLARIRWVTRVSGFHQVHPLIKLADGTWLVGSTESRSLADFDETEVSISDIRWLKLDIDRVVTVGRWVENPDLSKVDEIGYADLLPGSGHGFGGWVNVGRFEVYGNRVKR